MSPGGVSTSEARASARSGNDEEPVRESVDERSVGRERRVGRVDGFGRQPGGEGVGEQGRPFHRVPAALAPAGFRSQLAQRVEAG